MTDRELLELAAKAAGIKGHYATLDEFPGWMTVHDGEGIYYTSSQAWNPLSDDGDALRLAVKLSIYIQPFTEAQTPSVFARSINKIGTEQVLPLGDDPCGAVRRAIVRAAAEIGKIM